MNTRFALAFAVTVLLAPLAGHTENEIGWIEKFALAPDREAVLDELLPGSEDYYFFHALHYQNTRQAAKLAAILEQWAVRFPKSSRRPIIENRAALLAYDADPQATLKFLRDRLKIEFNDEQQARDQKPDLPTKLDPARISRAVFQREAFDQKDDVSNVDDEALATLLIDKVSLSVAQRRDLLNRLRRPDVPGLVDAVEADLKSKESRGFGEFEIHRALLPEQLDDLARRIPALYGSRQFVYARVRKLAPGADADAEFDPVEREAWLERLWNYVKNLGSSFNSLKAQVLLQRLELDRQRGTYDKARFLEYLKLPQRTPHASVDLLRRAESSSQVADLNADVSEAFGALPLIHSDEALVRDYLLHLLKDEPSWEPWSAWLRDTWLKPVFAEAKMVNGVGDPEKWASLLTPPAFQALKERVDVDFSPANPEFLAPGDEVSLDLFVKNTPKLIVKVYEINTLSYFLANARPLNTDLPLDGLVANREVTHDFSADEAGRNPFRRTLRTFKFPELKGQRGAWIIEFIGGGKSSRALVRKGQWSLLQRTGVAGDVITVLDETRQPVQDAVVWLEGRKWSPNAKTGEIVVPFAQQPGTKSIVLSNAAGTFATLAGFDHHSEEYRLDARIFIEREQLLAHHQATIAVRAGLLLNDAQVALDLIENPKLTIVSTTLDGVSTTSEVKIEKLDPTKVYTHEISVPERLAALSVTFSGQVEKMSEGGKKEDLSVSHGVALNGIDATEQISTPLLSRFEGNYFLDLLGRNGEPVPNRQVVLGFLHRDFHNIVSVPLRTDDHGRIDCGALADIARVWSNNEGESGSGTAGPSGNWQLLNAGRTWPQSIHAAAGEPISIPWTGAAAPARISLLEERGGTFVADRSAAVSLAVSGGALPAGKAGKGEPSAIVLTGLAAGDYLLTILHECAITIRVTAGQPVQNWLLAPNRELEVRDAAPLNISEVRREPDAILVQLANAGKFARVHVVATRFLPETNLLAGLGEFVRFDPASAAPAKAPNLFAAGRAIGDEYRYILERRYRKIFPGNMLPRPVLLLNPWEVRSTDLQSQSMQGMQRPPGAAGGRDAMKRKSEEQGKMRDGEQTTAAQSEDLEFLAQPAPALYNLVPDEKAQVRIDLKALGDRPYVQIYAEDLQSAAWRTVPLAEMPTKFQDLRLARNLDPQKPFTEKKEVTVLATGQTLQLADMRTAELETYDSLARVFSLLTTVSAGPKNVPNTPLPDAPAVLPDVEIGKVNLAKFSWIIQWPKLSDDEKRAKYSEFACHELNFFLARKDPPFFQKVVQPYLRNKKDRTFMDDFLLGDDLHGYLEPWAFARLNAAEHCLLAQRLPGEAAATARYEKEQWELLAPDPQREDLLFETALRGQSLTEGEVWNARHGAMAGQGAAGAAANALAAPAAAPAPVSLPSVTATLATPLGEIAASKPRLNGVNTYSGATTAQLGELALAPREMAKKAAPAQTYQWIEQNNLTEMNIDQTLGGVRLEREAVRQFFRALGPTKEWAENNYYHLPIGEQIAALIPINGFWRDYAAWDGKSPFVSANVAEAGHSFPEIIFALAVLDLPFESPQHTSHSENGRFSLTAAGPLIAFHKEIKLADPAPEQAPLLVSQNFFRASNRYREEGNEKFDIYVTDEFLAGAVYGANIVVTNPTSARQKVSVLLQIPRGSVPVNGSKATESRRLQLEPYSTATLEYYFYFPAPAAQPLPHYPVHVARDEQIVGEARPFVFKVVPQLTQVDKESWDYVSQYATDEEVFAFLEKTNIQRIDFPRIAWRVRKSADFFRRLVGVMEKRHVYNSPIYRYALVHPAPAALATWLRNQDGFINECGPYLDSKLLEIDPIERRAYEHLEYSPLVNQRSHRVGAENRIANPILREQYQHLMNILAYKPALDAVDEMSVVYYLFLQDRVEEALARFHAIAPAKLPTRLQYDYFRCYAAFYEEQPAVARGIAQQYADYPVDRWRKVFAEVSAQLDEIEGKRPVHPGDSEPNREKQQGELAATEPAFDFKVENRQIALTWNNLREVTIRYYLMDPEFLFSSSPFVTEDSGRFSIIKATRTDTQALPEGKDQLAIPLPAEFTKANVLVEILGAGQRKAQTYHANTLKLTLAENYGRLEARDDTENKPVTKAYVKVYARLRNGTVRFYKDGYTDLRGRFDYASLNSSETQGGPMPRGAGDAGDGMNYQMLSPGELSQVARFAILLLSEAHGAEVREAAPPAQ